MKIFYGFLILVVLVACESENEEDLFAIPETPMTDTSMTDTSMVDTTGMGGMTAVSFSMTIAPFFQNNCAISGCHAANTISPTMETYNQIKAQADGGRIRARAIDQMSMPPSGRPRLTNQQIDDLRSWLDNGAPNN